MKNLISQLFESDLLKPRIYRNKEITYSIPEDPNYVGKIDLEIDHKHVHALKLIDGTFATHFLPYLHYDSIEELTNEVIDKVPFYRS
jgi:hypothetical protein